MEVGSKLGGCSPLWGKMGPQLPIQHNVAGAEAYLHAKFHLDLSNCLTTIHQRHKQTGQDRQQSDRRGRTVYKWSPKNPLEILAITKQKVIYFFLTIVSSKRLKIIARRMFNYLLCNDKKNKSIQPRL